MRALGIALLCLASAVCSAQAMSPTNRQHSQASLIPYPVDARWDSIWLQTKGWNKADDWLEFESFRISSDNEDALAQLEVFLEREDIRVSPGSQTKFTLKTARILGATNPNEAYQLEVDKNLIEITAPTLQGHFYALQTLRQLIRTSKTDGIPYCRIIDWPAFPVRGFMHDLGRNPQSVEMLKGFIDKMSQYKLNTFHMHLTDHPGWRVESKAYPQLNTKDAYRQTRQPGFFYTYDELRDIIAFAKERHIQIIPEIDMPGHSTYFNNVFGFGMQDKRGLEVLKVALKEFFDEIPAADVPIFHMGSDEVRLTNPEFMDEIADTIRDHGREVVVWRPGHDPSGEVIHDLWSSVDIDYNTRHLDGRQIYINHMAPLTGPLRAWAKQYCGVRSVTSVSLGGMLCHWPDNNVGVQENIYKQSPVYPAMLAFAERIWRGSNHQRDDLYAQTPGLGDPDHREWTMFERDLSKHRDALLTDVPFQFVRNSQMSWELLGRFELRNEPEDPRAEEGWTGPIYGGTVQVHHKFDFPSFTDKRAGVVFARTYLQSDRDREITAWIGFDDFSRSGARRGGPFAAQGEWSRHGSQVWVNGKEVSPPVWKQPGLPAADKETPFVDELYWIRKPTTIKLKEGLNEILIRAPHKDVGFGWMFTFVPVDLSRGNPREVEGVSFGSPYGGISPR